MATNFTTLTAILDGLMKRYSERVPAVSVVLNALVREGLVLNSDGIENDHIAFRTMGVPQLGIRSLEKIFLHHGYIKRDHLNFSEKKLDAYWYSPPADKFPRIFISELRVNELTAKSREIILRYTGEVTSDPVDRLDLDDAHAVETFLHQALWSTPSWAEYQTLQSESEYAAWVIYNRYYLNHFTVSVHNLPQPYNTIEKFNEFVERQNIRLNDAGGKIKVSPDGLLRQSSTVAQMVDAEFSSASGPELHSISGSYVEFAERRVLPKFLGIPKEQIRREHRRDGFEASNADKIFESTYTSQTKERDA